MITIFAGAVLAVAVRYMQPLPKGFEQSATRGGARDDDGSEARI